LAVFEIYLESKYNLWIVRFWSTLLCQIARPNMVWCVLTGLTGSNRRPVRSMVVGRPILLALEDIDGSPSFLEKALTFIETYGMLFHLRLYLVYNPPMFQASILVPQPI